MTSENINSLLTLTNKKIEALSYLIEQLEIETQDADTYFSDKGKVEKALLKVDMEFLSIYNALLGSLGLNAIGELPKENYPKLKELKECISKVRAIEIEIQNLESSKVFKTQKNAKRQAPHAVKAYEKFKK